MILPWAWGPAYLALLVVATVGALRSAISGQHKLRHMTFTILATLVLSGGIALQCTHGISIIGSMANSLLPLCFFLLMSSLALEISIRTPWVPLLTHPVALVLGLVALRFMKPIPISDHASSLLRAHILSSVLGYVLLILSSLAAVLLWIQDRRLKRHMRLPGKLPSLELLETLASRFLLTSAIFLTVSIGMGAWHGSTQFGHGFSGRFQWIFGFTLATWSLQLAAVVLAWKRILTAGRLVGAILLILVVALLGLLGRGH